MSSPGSGAISGADWLGAAMSGGRSSGGGGGGFGGGRAGGTMSRHYQDPQGNIYNKYEENPWQRSPASFLADRQQGLAERQQGFQENKFNQVWGALSGLLGRFGNGPPTKVGGDSGAGPHISAGPVYSPEQIQQNVNAARAQNEGKAATAMKKQREALAGRGFGDSSPLLAAMQASMNAGMMGANADAERGIRQGAAEMNAGQLLKGQTARENQYASRQAEQIQRERPWWNQTNALISAIAGLA